MRNHSEKRSAFTLIELLVVMAVIAILMTLGAVGINAVLQSSRDTQRRDAITALNTAIGKSYVDNEVYPTNDGSATAIATVLDTAGTSSITIGTVTVPLEGPAEVGTATTTGATNYCYTTNTSNTAYGLCGTLEGGSNFCFGTETCTP